MGGWDDEGHGTARGGMAHEAASGVVLPALIDALPDAVVVADADGRILYANPAVTSLLGHRADTLHGESLTVLMPTRLRTAHGAGFARFLATGSGELIGSTTQVPALHAGGWEVPIDLTLSPLDPGAEGAIAGGVVVGVLRDASTTVLLERQLEVSRYLAATLRVTSALTEAPDADVAFERLLPTLCAELDWDAATLWQPEGPAGRLTYAGTWSAPGEALPHMHAVTLGRTFARGEGMPGLVWQRRGPVVVRP